MGDQYLCHVIIIVTLYDQPENIGNWPFDVQRKFGTMLWCNYVTNGAMYIVKRDAPLELKSQVCHEPIIFDETVHMVVGLRDDHILKLKEWFICLLRISSVIVYTEKKKKKKIISFTFMLIVLTVGALSSTSHSIFIEAFGRYLSRDVWTVTS